MKSIYAVSLLKSGCNVLQVSVKKKVYMIITLFFLFIHMCNLTAQLQQFNKENYVLRIPKVHSGISIDGVLNEHEWDLAKSDSNFWFHYPVDSSRANIKTEVKMMYDDSKIYIGFICYDAPDEPVVQSMKRDDASSYSFSEGVSIVIDPLNTDKSGYYFGVNALGTEIDGTVFQNGMEPYVNNNWNNKWESKVVKNGNTITYEIAIPFSALRYDEKNNTWGINFIRNDISRNMVYSWTWFQANKHNYDFGYNGTLFFEGGLPSAKSSNFLLMPSATSKISRNEENEKNARYKFNGGIDAKTSLGSAMNLDLSIYPDFSDVAVDQQYIDFYRFEYYMQEQRGFFLENNDLFSSFGTYEDGTTSPTDYRIKPIYTRRLGIVDGENVPIVYGARLSGSLTEKLRVGLLNMQSEAYGNSGQQNYTVGAFQYGIFNRSAIKGIFTNRQSNKEYKFSSNDYNRTAGVELDFSTEDGSWTANAKYHNSFSPQKYNDNKFYGGGFTFSTKNFKSHNWINHVDKNYIADLGFIPRLYYKDPVLDTTYRFGYTQLTSKQEYYHFLNNDFIKICGEYINFSSYLDESGKLNEIASNLGYWSVFANNMHIVLDFTYKKFDLLVPHDVLDNDKPVPLGTYENPSLYFFFESDARQKFKYNFSVEYGKYYNGKIFTFNGGPSYTIQPYGTISMMYSLADIDLTKELGRATYHLLGIKSEISFTTNLLWTSLVQYNTQKEKANFNSIFQWRFAPMSDFFFVLKNDLSTASKNNDWEISFKLTYWADIL